MQHELLLLGRRKHAPAHFADKAISSVLVAPRTAHSEKPAIVHNLIERATPGPYIELFGRTAVTGWTVVGNQLPSMDSARQLAAPGSRQALTVQFIEIAVFIPQI
jgi:N6-adenosine-specific RNA methylase IME4